MSIPKLNPNTILLASKGGHLVNDLAAGVAITPGMLIERYQSGDSLNSGGQSTASKWRPQASATNASVPYVALNQDEMNLGIDDPYAINDLVKAYGLLVGDVFYGIIGSGQNVSDSDLLQSNGDGRLKAATSAAASAGVAKYQALPGAPNTTVYYDTRIRVERVA